MQTRERTNWDKYYESPFVASSLTLEIYQFAPDFRDMPLPAKKWGFNCGTWRSKQLLLQRNRCEHSVRVLSYRRQQHPWHNPDVPNHCKRPSRNHRMR